MPEFPYYESVPKDFKENLRYRRKLLVKAKDDNGMQRALWNMCRDDLLFYINIFCWTYNPRNQKGDPKVLPFITYGFQDEALFEIKKSMERQYDLAMPKSRDMGASWMGLSAIEHDWHFNPDMISHGLLSRNEAYVDNSSDPKSLFWKIDFLHAHQPAWMLPPGVSDRSKDVRSNMKIKNKFTGSTIIGEPTTGDTFRGGRLGTLFIDEAAAGDVSDGFNALNATRDVSDNRIYNSTPQGTGNAFYEVVHNMGTKVVELFWAKHPVKSIGLYGIEKTNGRIKPKLMDEFRGMVRTNRIDWDEPRDFLYPDEYPFVLNEDFELRSPWFDEQESRVASKKEIGQEINIDWLGSSYQFFDATKIRKLILETCRPATHRGFLKFNKETLEPEGFELDPKGPMHLWFEIKGTENILTDRDYFKNKTFGVGCDISAGTGSSNSAASIVDLENGHKIGLWVDPNTLPTDFADASIAICKYFNNARLIWDALGPTGETFSNRVIEKKYTRLYYAREENNFERKRSRKPGAFLMPTAKFTTLSDYRNALGARDFVNYSESGMQETLQFIRDGEKVEHQAAVNSQDPTAQKTGHGDEVIADALANKLVLGSRKDPEVEKKELPEFCFAKRFQREKMEAAMANDPW